MTEADIPGRRRGDEPFEPGKVFGDSGESWQKRFEAIPDSLKSVVNKKLAKNYSAEVSLVIYVNLGSYGAYQKEGIPILCEGTRIAKDAFKEILVLWEGTLFSFWRDGRQSFATWRTARLTDL